MPRRFKLHYSRIRSSLLNQMYVVNTPTICAASSFYHPEHQITPLAHHVQRSNISDEQLRCRPPHRRAHPLLRHRTPPAQELLPSYRPFATSRSLRAPDRWLPRSPPEMHVHALRDRHRPPLHLLHLPAGIVRPLFPRDARPPPQRGGVDRAHHSQQDNYCCPLHR